MSDMSSKFEVKQTEDSQGDAIFTVYLDGESVFVWDDSANSDYPEDLSWNRLISDTFYSGVSAGVKSQSAEIEIYETEQKNLNTKLGERNRKILDLNAEIEALKAKVTKVLDRNAFLSRERDLYSDANREGKIELSKVCEESLAQKVEVIKLKAENKELLDSVNTLSLQNNAARNVLIDYGQNNPLIERVCREARFKLFEIPHINSKEDR